MKNLRYVLAIVGVVIISFSAHGSAYGEPVKLKDLTIEGVWTRPSPGQPNNAAIFMKISNSGKSWDRLVFAETAMAGNTILHKSTIMSGLLKMYLTKGMYIDPGKTLTMKPEKFHIMLVDLNKKMVIGKTFTLTLTFEKAGAIEVQVLVKKDKGSGGKTKDRTKRGV